MIKDFELPPDASRRRFFPPDYADYPSTRAEEARRAAIARGGDPDDYSNNMTAEQRLYARRYIPLMEADARMTQSQKWKGRERPVLEEIDYQGSSAFVASGAIHLMRNPRWAEQQGFLAFFFMGLFLWFGMQAALIVIVVLASVTGIRSTETKTIEMIKSCRAKHRMGFRARK
jgi:hypothetical protein